MQITIKKQLYTIHGDKEQNVFCPTLKLKIKNYIHLPKIPFIIFVSFCTL